MSLTLRFRRSWTSWLQRRLLRRQQRAVTILHLALEPLLVGQAKQLLLLSQSLELLQSLVELPQPEQRLPPETLELLAEIHSLQQATLDSLVQPAETQLLSLLSPKRPTSAS